MSQVITVNGVECHPIVEKCEGCDRILEQDGAKYCKSYSMPERKWAQKVCNFATHMKLEIDKGGKTKVNPLKASKRAARGR